MREVVKALGGVVATARLLGVTQPAISTWLAGYQRFPPARLERLRELAAALVRQVSAALPELQRLQRENEEQNRLRETRWKPARGDSQS